MGPGHPECPQRLGAIADHLIATGLDHLLEHHDAPQASDEQILRAHDADYLDSLLVYGSAFYRNLFWEAGLVGQVLYLEAEEAGIRSTGIGCYFDDPVHEVFGISSRDWQSLYHFTVGGHVDDVRLTTLPPYAWQP